MGVDVMGDGPGYDYRDGEIERRRVVQISENKTRLGYLTNMIRDVGFPKEKDVISVMINERLTEAMYLLETWLRAKEK